MLSESQGDQQHQRTFISVDCHKVLSFVRLDLSSYYVVGIILNNVKRFFLRNRQKCLSFCHILKATMSDLKNSTAWLFCATNLRGVRKFCPIYEIFIKWSDGNMSKVSVIDATVREGTDNTHLIQYLIIVRPN